MEGRKEEEEKERNIGVRDTYVDWLPLHIPQIGPGMKLQLRYVPLMMNRTHDPSV